MANFLGECNVFVLTSNHISFFLCTKVYSITITKSENLRAALRKFFCSFPLQCQTMHAGYPTSLWLRRESSSRARL